MWILDFVLPTDTNGKISWSRIDKGDQLLLGANRIGRAGSRTLYILPRAEAMETNVGHFTNSCMLCDTKINVRDRLGRKMARAHTRQHTQKRLNMWELSQWTKTSWERVRHGGNQINKALWFIGGARPLCSHRECGSLHKNTSVWIQQTNAVNRGCCTIGETQAGSPMVICIGF